MDTAKLSKKVSKNTKPKKKAQAFFLVCGVVGLVFVIIGGYSYVSYQRTVLSFTTTPPQADQTNRKAIPRHITISKAEIDLPIEEGSIQEGVWLISKTNATHLSTSARPGETGNIVIYGHNKKVIFGPLWVTKPGDKITIETSDGTKHDYTVFNKVQVKPTDIRYVEPTSSEILTIYTCIGLLDSERLILQASPSGTKK